MVEGLANRWADYMIENGADREQRAVYVYGLICFMNELSSSILLLAIALPINRVWQIVVWMIVFDMLRLNIGGYHADTPGWCITQSTFIGILCTLVYPLFDKGAVFTCLIGAICIIIVFRISPVLNQKHPLSEKRQRRARVLARTLIIFYSLLAAIIVPLNREFAAMISVSMVTVCLLGLLGHLKSKYVIKSCG